ncbi:MAG: hypothetical protein EOP51_35225 [Sphingobacteriales bacterium]|nr:MAG: hypothetical protein EOP51_35225 [Sphingobacteriales bacterium]
MNTAIGNQSLFSNISGSQNTALGRGALFANASGSQNTALGFQGLYNNVTGARNTAVGYNSLIINVDGADNTAVGHGSLLKNIANGNTAVGSAALNASSTGTKLTALGYAALTKNTTGDFNTAVGSMAMGENVNGFGNTAVGNLSMGINVNGTNNTAVGTGSLSKNVSGNYNTAIGFDADVYGDNYYNATAVGAFSEAGCSNCVVLGSVNGYNGATASAKVGIGAPNPQKTLHVNPNGAGGMMIGNNITTGGYTVMNMGISQAAGGYSFIQSVKSAWPSSTYGDLVLNQSGGNVGIRTTAPLTPFHLKQIDNTLDFNFSYNGTPKLFFEETDGEITIVSDMRMKKDIQPIESALPSIMKLEAKSYHYKDNAPGSRLSYGFLAQDVEKIFPDFVTTKGADQLKAVGYQKLNVMAIKVALVCWLNTNPL